MQYSADMMACCSIMMMATITNDHKEKKNTLKLSESFTKYFLLVLSCDHHLKPTPPHCPQSPRGSLTQAQFLWPPGVKSSRAHIHSTLHSY